MRNRLAGDRLRGDIGLDRTAASTLMRHDRAADQQLAAPDTPGLAALERAGQARDPGPASPAHRLRPLHILRRLGEEQLRILPAGKIKSKPRRVYPADGGSTPLHRCHPLSPIETRPREPPRYLFACPVSGWERNEPSHPHTSTIRRQMVRRRDPRWHYLAIPSLAAWRRLSEAHPQAGTFGYLGGTREQGRRLW